MLEMYCSDGLLYFCGKVSCSLGWLHIPSYGAEDDFELLMLLLLPPSAGRECVCVCVRVPALHLTYVLPGSCASHLLSRISSPISCSLMKKSKSDEVGTRCLG